MVIWESSLCVPQLKYLPPTLPQAGTRACWPAVSPSIHLSLWDEA